MTSRFDVDDETPAFPTPEVPAPAATSSATLRVPEGKSTALPPGAALGRYLILDTLGEGGMGVVYAAYDKELDRKVALKLLRPGAGGDSQASLYREAQAMAKLAHPNVVAVHDVLLVEEQVAVVMELVEGQTLRGWLKQPHSWEEKLFLLQGAAEGLAAAHAAGILHRDFKPDNVLVGNDGRARVADFGIARASGSTASAAGTPPSSTPAPSGENTSSRRAALFSDQPNEEGRAVGTPPYMAPELWAGTPADARADQFAFGVTLYEAFAGQRPFDGASQLKRLKSMVEGRIAPPPPGAKFPAWLLKVATRALAADPESRFPDMRALLAALSKDPRKRRNQWLAIGAVTLSLALAVGLVFRARSAQAHLCEGFESSLAGIWDTPTRAAVERGVTSTSVPYAPAAWTLLDSRLGAYARAWVAQNRDACVAARLRGEQSDEVLSLRTGCLQERLTQLSAIVRLYQHPDAKAVERAAQTTEGLAPVADCGDVPMLLTRVKPPKPPEARRRLVPIRAQLAEARVSLIAGKFAEADKLAKAAEREALPLEHPPTVAEALELQAQAAHETGRFSEGIRLAQEALALAIEGSDDARAASSALIYARDVILTRGPGYEVESRRLMKLVTALNHRAGTDASVEILNLNLESMVVYNTQGPAAAREPMRRAYARAKTTLGPDHSTTQGLGYNVALNLVNLGRFEEALVLERELVDLVKKTRGSMHSFLAWPLYSEAEALLELGRLNESVMALRQSMAILGPLVPGGVHPVLQADEFVMGLYELEIGDSAQGLLHLEKARRIAMSLNDDDGILNAAAAELRLTVPSGSPVQPLDLLTQTGPWSHTAPGLGSPNFDAWLGEALLRQGDLNLAQAAFERAIETLQASAGTHPFLWSYRVGLGRVALARGDVDKASALAEDAVRELATKLGRNSPRLFDALVLHGEARWAAGDFEPARATLTEAVRLGGELQTWGLRRAEAAEALAGVRERRRYTRQSPTTQLPSARLREQLRRLALARGKSSIRA